MQVSRTLMIKSSGAAFVVMFGLSILFTGLADDTFRADIDKAFLRDSPGVACITLGYLALSILLAWIYPHYRAGRGPVWQRGLQFGVVMALLWMFPLSLVWHGVYRLSFLMIIVNILWALIEQGIGGVVIAAIYHRFQKRHITSHDEIIDA